MVDEQLQSRIDFLRNVRIFRKASNTELVHLASTLSDQIVHKGEKIICKGDIANNMFIIAKGRVKIHDGDHVFNEVGRGHVFGEYSLFHTHTRTASVTTLETTYLLKLSQSDFKKLLNHNQDIQLGIIESLIDTIAIQNELEKELAKKKDQIEIQKKELEKAIKTKDRFFSLLAHDLRSPLSTLGSYLNLIINSELLTREEIVKYASDIQVSVENVVEMLNNLLNWAISETGEWNMKLKNFNIIPSITKVIELYNDPALKNNITITNNTNPFIVYADQNSLDVILRNLLSNAIKYTPKNGNITLESKGEGDFIIISVSDNGKGMDKETIANLFSIDIKDRRSNQEAGTGLGLLLSKEFAEKNGGSLYFDSKVNLGSTFYIKLQKGK